MDPDSPDPRQTALHRNPFHVIGASLDSTRQDIARLAAERALVSSESSAQEARSALIRPQSRLTAEVGWLPGVGPEVIQQLVEFNRLDADVLQYTSAPVLTLANAYAAMLEQRISTHHIGSSIQQEITRFLRLVDHIVSKDVVDVLNPHRAVSQFPALTEPQVSIALQEQRRYYQSVCDSVLGKLAGTWQSSILSTALKSAGQHAHFIHDVVDAYELRHAAVFDEHLRGLRGLLGRIRQDPHIKGAPLFQWKRLLPHYANVIGPVLGSRHVRGLRHRETEALVSETRDTAVDLANAQEAYETSRDMLVVLQNAFAGNASIVAAVSEDLGRLEDILRQSSSVSAPTRRAGPAPQEQETEGRPTPAPVPLPTGTDRPKKGRIWRYVVAALVLLFLVNAFSSEAYDKSSQNRTETSGATVSRNSCDGVDTWWDGTQDRVRRSNSIIDGLLAEASDASRRSAQIKINAIAGEQENSDPPGAAQSLNEAHVALFHFIAADLTEMGSTEAQRDLQLGILQADVIQKQNALAKACDFEIVESTRTS